MKNKNIIIISTFCKSNKNPTNGIEKYVYKLFSILKNLNIAFNCIILNNNCLCSEIDNKCIVLNSKILKNYSSSKNISFKKLFYSFFIRFVAKKVNKIISKNNFEVVVNNTFLQIKAKKNVWVQHSSIKVYKGDIFNNNLLNFFSKIIRLLSKLSSPWKKANIIINYTKEDSIDFKTKKNSKFFYIPLFSNTTLINHFNKSNNFIWIGRFSNNDKNLFFLKDVGNEIYKLSGLNIDIYGYGPEEKIFNKFLSKGILLKGKLNNSEVIKTLSNYKTLILTSNYEGFSFVIVEALATGTFTIARNASKNFKFLLNSGRGKIIDKNVTPKCFALESLKTIRSSENINRENLVKFFNENLTEKKFEENWIKVINYINSLN